MSRRPSPFLASRAAIAALLVAGVGAGVGAWRESRSQGWLDDGLGHLALLDFLRRFDPWAAAGLGIALLALLVARLLGRWRPATGDLGAALAVVAGVGLLRLGALWIDTRGPGRPNLILVSIDTLRADRLGAYGYVPPTSPAFDRRLAAESVIFENVMSQSPETTPSHMTLLTSLYPSTHGIALWDGQTSGPALNPRVDTLAEVLRNAGYTTAAFTGGAHMHRARGFGQGFQRYRHSDQLRRAREWLRDRAGRSFFLFFHTYQVHDPYTPPPELIPLFDREYGQGPILDVVRRIRAGGAGGWEHGHRAFWDAVDEANPRDVQFISHLYDAGIRYMDDDTLTALLDELDALDLTSDTLVVLTSDHGEAFGEHGRFLHDDLNGGTLHVPLVLRFPGRLPGGTRIPQRVELVDVMPTILELLDIPAPPDMQGHSLVPLIRGTGGAPIDDTAISEYSNPATGRIFESIRRGSDTLIRDGEQVQLFDLATDPGEQRDRAAADPTRVASLRTELDAWRTQCAALAQRLGPQGRAGEGPDAETLRRLRALGYVE